MLLDPTRYRGNVRFKFQIRLIYNLGSYNLYKVTPSISKSGPTSKHNEGGHVLEFLTKFYDHFRHQLKPKQQFIIKIPKSFPDEIHRHAQSEKIFGHKMYNLHPELFVHILRHTGAFLISPLYKHTLNSVTSSRPLSFWTNVIKQLTQAVFRCHEAGIVHGDVKPDNIFVTTDSKVLLGDWDISQNLNADKFDFATCTPDYASNMNPIFRLIHKNSDLKHPCFNHYAHKTCRVINDYYGLVAVMTTIMAHIHQKNDTFQSVDRFVSYQTLIDSNDSDRWTYLFRPYTEGNPHLVFDMCKKRILYYSNNDIMCHILERLLQYRPPDTENEIFFVEIIWKCKCAIVQAFLEKRSPTPYQVFIPSLCRYYAKSSDKKGTREKIKSILRIIYRKLKWPRYKFTRVRSNSWWHWGYRKKKNLMLYLPTNRLDATLQQHVWQYVNGWSFELQEWTGGTLKDAHKMGRLWGRKHGCNVDLEMHRCLK